jgi:hypothetical protein
VLIEGSLAVRQCGVAEASLEAALSTTALMAFTVRARDPAVAVAMAMSSGLVRTIFVNSS